MQTTRRIIRSFTIAAALASLSALLREGLAAGSTHAVQPLIGYGGGSHRKLSVPSAGGSGRKRRLREIKTYADSVKGLFPKTLTDFDCRNIAAAEEKRTRRYPQRAVIRSLGLPLRNL